MSDEQVCSQKIQFLMGIGTKPGRYWCGTCTTPVTAIVDKHFSTPEQIFQL